MTKIAIISQPEQGVLIDIGGCDSIHEATQHLSSTFQVSNQFWEDQPVDLNLGKLRLSQDELAQILAILSERGVATRQFFAETDATKSALRAHNVEPASGKPGESPLPPPPAAPESKTQVQNLAAWSANATSEPGTESKQQAAAEEPGSVVSQAGLNNGTDAEPAAGTEAGAADGIASTTNNSPATDNANSSEAVADSEAGTACDTKPAKPEAPAGPHVLYLRQTLRSGQSVTHKGHLVIIGDVNPGAEVSAEGDITVWGSLRGIAHAGTAGNTNAEIRALKFDPIQLRIAQAIARSPDKPKVNLRTNGPETARIVNGTIRISSSAPE